jgi:hypothetical protein
MLRTPGGDYPLCVLDTMVVSEMVKRPEDVRRRVLEWAMLAEPRPFAPSFTVYTLMELRRAPRVFEQFIELFGALPCVMLKGYHELLAEEVDGYPDPSSIEPWSLTFSPLGDGARLADLPTILSDPELLERERGWVAAAPEIVSGMVSMVPNYVPDGSTYTQAEVELFVSAASLQQLALHGYMSFIHEILDQAGQPVDMAAFPSLKSMTYAVFHKFYADLSRKPRTSDAFDVLIAAALPYVEAIITEAHLAEALRKTKRRDPFLDHLRIFTLRDFRARSPQG